MSSPEPGAGALRSADIEAWLASLGLSPTERADRDGITSWDLILDGRRRFDLRLTVILDPALAVICWAHYAPPITDMFRRSYRKLLRWNDEFPFAKFSVGEDERPLLAVELPVGARRRGRPRPGHRPDPGHRRPPRRGLEGMAVARRPDARPDRPDVAQRRPPRALRGAPARAVRDGDDAEAAAEAATDPNGARSRAHRGVRTSHRGPARHLAALVFAIAAASGLLAIPAVAPEVRAATPDLTIVSQARYDVQPDQHRIRVTVDLVLTNHLRDTTTKRYYFDRAFLSVLPGSSGLSADRAGHAEPSGSARGRRRRRSSTCASASACSVARPRTTSCASIWSTRAATATRDVRVGSALVSFPVWAFASNSTPGSTVRVVFPAGFQVEVEAGTIPAPKTDSAGSGRLRQRLDRQAAQLLRLSRRRPCRRVRGEERHDDGRRGHDRPQGPVLARRPGLVEAGRRSRPEGAARTVDADRAGLAQRPVPRHRRVGQPRDRWLRRAVRPGRRSASRSPTSRPTSSSSTSRRTPGSTARCWPTAGRTRAFASYYAGLVAPKFKAKVEPIGLGTDLERPRSRSTRGAPSARRRPPPRTTPTPHRSISPRRSPSVPARTVCARSGPTPRTRSGRTSRRAG